MFNRFGEKYKGKIIMIAGGVDKGLEYKGIVGIMKEYLKGLILLEGTASEKIADYMSDSNNVYKYYNNLEEAIQKAKDLATNGDMVILCPGASSFNMFANEFDRGEKYVTFVNNIN
jgi:UDP-N-acetylmuramoylalanine--D-glutamate ligase